MNAVETKCREAEAFSLDALDAIEMAQKADSEGGSTITAREASRVRMLVLCSAITNSEAATMAEVAKVA